MTSREFDPDFLITEMQRGVEQIERVRQGFEKLRIVEQELIKEVDLVAETKAFFGELDLLAPDETMKDLIIKRASKEQVNPQAAYAGLLLSGRDQAIGNMLREWTEREDIQALQGVPITIRSNGIDGPLPTMRYDHSNALLHDESYMSGEIKAVSLFQGGTIMVGPGYYGLNSSPPWSGGLNEGMVGEVFYLRNTDARPLVQVEAGLTQGHAPGEALTAAA